MTDTKSISRLEVTPKRYELIKQSEAVAIRNYDSPEGRYGTITMIGTYEECEESATTPGILIVPEPIEYLGSEVVWSADLLPPDLP